MVTKSHNLPLQLRAHGIREKWMQAVCRGERRRCRAPPPHLQITQNWGSCRGPPYSSLDPKKPQAKVAFFLELGTDAVNMSRTGPGP